MIPQSEYIREEIVELALKNQFGNTALAAAELGISRGQLVDYLARHPDLAQVRRDIKESIKDQAEDLLIQKMQTDNTLLMFYLRTQAADRGYGNTSGLTVTGKNGGAIEVNVNARTLIAAMRNGFEDNEKNSDETNSNLLPE